MSQQEQGRISQQLIGGTLLSTKTQERLGDHQPGKQSDLCKVGKKAGGVEVFESRFSQGLGESSKQGCPIRGTPHLQGTSLLNIPAELHGKCGFLESGASAGTWILIAATEASVSYTSNSRPERPFS